MARGKARAGRYSPERGGGAGDDGGDDSRWLTTYGDAVTLLLAFFVMLFSMSHLDAARFEAIAAALSAALSGTPAGGDGILDARDAIVGDETDPRPPTDGPPADAAAAQLADELRQAVAAAGLPDLASVSVEDADVVVRVGTDGVLFETGSAAVRPDGRRIIAALAPVLAREVRPIRVEGHTDDVPLRRAGYTNWNLSTERAVAVLTLLYRDHGISQERLSAVGYGEFEPLVANDSPANRATNRRVEIVIAAPVDR